MLNSPNPPPNGPPSGIYDPLLRGPKPGDPARPLKVGEFRLISMGGFGDGMNSYPYGYRWFNDHLLVGTNRNLLLMMKQRFPFKLPFDPFPVWVPEERPDPETMCAEIWRYNPKTDVWARSYRSTLVEGIEGPDALPVPLCTGFRNMTIFQGRSDSAPCVYTIPNCGSYGKGPVLLRSEDGISFEQVSEQGMGLDDRNIVSFRGCIAFKGKVFATPAGSRGFDPNVSYNATVICTDDPAASNWERSSELGFGDRGNQGIFEIGCTDTHLYAGTFNLREGCQLWKTDGEGPPPHRWTKVFDKGAGRGALNQGIVSMMPFRGALYIGTGIQNGGFDRVNKVGPAPAEVLRVWPDDSFDLIAGDPRCTDWGMKMPISGFGAGFDNPFGGYMWRCGLYDGTIYFGTYDSTVFVPYATTLDDRAKHILEPDVIDRYLDFRGGCELWGSADGERWVPVTRNGFGNRYNFGFRTLMGTPAGLFVGAANPFGPLVAERNSNGWRYERNPRGGCEIFHGFAGHTSEDISTPPVEVRTRTVERVLREYEQRANEPDLPEVTAEEEAAEEDPSPPPLKRHLGEVLEKISVAMPTMDDDPVAALVAQIPFRRPETPDDRVLRKIADEAIDPIHRLVGEMDTATMESSLERDLDEYWSGSLRNAGLWRRGADTPAVAAQALIEDLVAHLPEGPHSMLAIGAGVEVMVRIATDLRSDCLPAAVVFDDATEALVSGRGIDTVRCDPAHIDFGEERYDAVLWIEGPEETGRVHGFREAARVLRPGGVFAVVDLVAPPSGDAEDDGTTTGAMENYRSDLEAVGFTDVLASDFTNRGWHRFFKHSRNFHWPRFLMGQVDEERRDAIFRRLPGGKRIIAAHVFAKAIKDPALEL